MRVLLDTHAVIWALMEPRRLGPTAGAAVRSRATELVVSAASAWEMATKVRLGKLPTAAAIVDGYGAHLERLAASELSISPAHALLAGSLRWDHADPFDRMLAAQAMLENVPLVSMDPAFSTLPGLTVRW